MNIIKPFHFHFKSKNDKSTENYENKKAARTARKKRSKLIIDPLVMYFSENFNVVGISGVNVCPVLKIGFHVPVVVLKLK